MSNKIIIINPPSETKVIREGRCEQSADSYQYLMVPISLPSIAAVLLEKKFEVKIFDCIADNISFYELGEKIEQENPFLVIVNVATMSFEMDKEVAKICKKLGIKCSAMGMHVTTLPKQSLEESEFDFVIKGEPELISLNLAKAIKGKKDLKKIKGIAYRKNSKIYENGNEKLIEDLDAMPFPARHLINNEKYIAPLTKRPYTLIVTGRGCPYGCIFCTADKYYGKKQRRRSPENIVNEIQEVVEKYGIRDIGMWSDTFTFDKNQVIGISKEIIKRGLKIKWFCNSRVDTIDKEMLYWMSKSGCKVITFGVESLDEKILKNIRKYITLEQVERAIKLCKKYKIQGQLHLIFGLPGETRETIEKTIKRVIKIDPDYAQFYCAVPFPGTEFRKQVNEKGYIDSGKTWKDYEINNAIVSYPRLSSKEIQEAKKKAYFRFYFRPKYIFRKMKEFPISKWDKIGIQAYNFFFGWVLKN